MGATVDAMAWLGVGTGGAENAWRLLAEEGPSLNEVGQKEPRDARDADAMLNVLLERLDVALVDIRADVNGMPLFAVEGKLTQRLREELPGVRVTAQDIRTWSAEISS